jgi:hypothetical protein
MSFYENTVVFEKHNCVSNKDEIHLWFVNYIKLVFSMGILYFQDL